MEGAGRYVSELLAAGRAEGLRLQRQRRRRMVTAVAGAAAVGFAVGCRFGHSS